MDCRCYCLPIYYYNFFVIFRSNLTDNSQNGTLNASGSSAETTTITNSSDRDFKNKHSLSTTDSGESTPVIRPKSFAGLTLQNVKAHEYAYQPHGLPRSEVRDDESSVYSVDQEGFYTSMHKDSGLICAYGNLPEGHIPSESEHDTSSTLTDMSTLSRSAEKAKKRSFLSKIPGFKKLKNRKSKHNITSPPLSPPSVTDSFYMNRRDLNQSDFEFPAPPTNIQLNIQESAYSSNETLMSSKRSSGISGSRSFNNSDTDIETVYTRLHKKTNINADAFPSMCPPLAVEEDANSSTCSGTFSAIAQKGQTVTSLEKLVKQLSLDDTSSGDGYSTWPRSPAKVIAPPEATTPTMDPSKLLDKLDVVHHIDKTVEDLDSKSLASSNSFKSISAASDRGAKLTLMPPVVPKRVSSSLSSGSIGSASVVSDDVPPDLPPKYHHPVVSRQGLNNETGHVYANMQMSESDAATENNVYHGHYETMEGSKHKTMLNNGQPSPQAGSLQTTNENGMSTWPRNMKNIVTVSKLKKADALDENSPKVKLTSFRPLVSPEVKPELQVPVSKSETVRPSTLAVSSVANVLPASAQLIISSPMSNHVSHAENPFKRSMCSPVTDEELNRFGMYNSVDSGFDSLPRKGAVQQSISAKPPRPQSFHTRVDIPRKMHVSRSLSFSGQETVPQSPSEPLYPTLESMKHSITYPIREKAQTDSSNHGRSWYDGLVGDDHKFRPVSQPLEWLPDPCAGEKRNPPARRKRPRIHSDSSIELQKSKNITHQNGPFKVGKRSNFGAFQLANSQNGQQMVPNCNFAQGHGQVFSAVATGQNNHSPNKHARKRPSFTSFLKSPTSQKVTTPDAASSPSTPTSPSTTNTFEVLSQMRRDIQLKAVDANKISSQEGGSPVFFLSPNGNAAFEQDRGWGLSTIAEGSESDPEARSVPTSPIARILHESGNRASPIITDVIKESEGCSVPTSPDDEVIFCQTDTGTIKRSPKDYQELAPSYCDVNVNTSNNVNNQAIQAEKQKSIAHTSPQRKPTTFSTQRVKSNSFSKNGQSKNETTDEKEKKTDDHSAIENDKKILNNTSGLTSKEKESTGSPSTRTKPRQLSQNKLSPNHLKNQGNHEKSQSEKGKVTTSKLSPKVKVATPHNEYNPLKPFTQKAGIKSSDVQNIENKSKSILLGSSIDKVKSPNSGKKELSTGTGPLSSKPLDAKPPKVPQNNPKVPPNSKTDSAQTDAKKSMLLPKLRPFKPAEVKYSWTSSKKVESKVDDVAKNNTNVAECNKVNDKNIINDVKSATSPRPKSNTNEEHKENEKSMGEKQHSKSTVSLTNTGGHSPSMSIANKNSAARMAFLSSDQDIHQSSKVNDRFARYTLGNSSTSLSGSTTSLRMTSKSTEV